MQDLMNKAKTKAMTVAYSAKAGLDKVKAAVSSRDGQGALDTAVTVLISIVLGALILGGLYLIINGTVLPQITERIREMFNYKG
ncbi:MAG: DUF6133 family protein [Candidatus Dehalobacter alkaniphilus]|uniref:DUF6133 family protein n=1 Tax=Dehalobacter sp. DCM TaxID=2907827 RepID=UPI003081D386|nr:DUF6133 family protein [Dehalobacter sp. DCM]